MLPLQNMLYLQSTMRKSKLISATVLLLSGITASAQKVYEVPFPRLTGDNTDTLSLFIIGDVMMHSGQLGHDHTEFLSRISPQMKEADVCIANMEFTLAGPPYSGYPRFSCPDDFPGLLASECGLDIFLTANNHILDYGSQGLERTLRHYEDMAGSLGVSYTGSALTEEDMCNLNPLMIKRKGFRIALINFTYGTNLGSDAQWPAVCRMKKEAIHSAFERARARGADFIIALPHWGTEYVLTHDKTQEQWAEWLVGEGADIIIGGHPHVVQDTTHFNGVPVIYSLGNAVSNMSAVNTRLGLAVSLKFVVNRNNGVKTMMEPQLDFIWCTLPGKLTSSYATIFVKEWANRRDDWLTPSDFDNMVETCSRVKAATGI